MLCISWCILLKNILIYLLTDKYLILPISTFPKPMPFLNCHTLICFYPITIFFVNPISHSLTLLSFIICPIGLLAYIWVTSSLSALVLSSLAVPTSFPQVPSATLSFHVKLICSLAWPSFPLVSLTHTVVVSECQFVLCLCLQFNQSRLVRGF